MKLKNTKSFIGFAEESIDKTRKMKLNKNNKPKRGTLYAKRNKNIAIRKASKMSVSVVITYLRDGQGKKFYEVNPISFRRRLLKAGLRKVLYAHDKNDSRSRKQLKSFVWNKVTNVALTEKRFKSKFKEQL